ncbi:MAG: DinB family protein [Thermoanaerobaculia bacterium]
MPLCERRSPPAAAVPSLTHGTKFCLRGRLTGGLTKRAFLTSPDRGPGVFLRRLNHSAHHRGQLTVYLRLLGRPVYSIYGPTADTGGLFLQHAPTLYRYKSLEHLLTAEGQGASGRSFPGQARLLPRSVRRLSEDAGYPTRGGEQRCETRFWRWSWQRLS